MLKDSATLTPVIRNQRSQALGYNRVNSLIKPNALNIFAAVQKGQVFCN